MSAEDAGCFPNYAFNLWNDNKSFAFIDFILFLHQFIIHFLFDLFESPVGISTASESQSNFFLLKVSIFSFGDNTIIAI